MNLYDEFDLSNNVHKKNDFFFKLVVSCLKLVCLFFVILLFMTGFTNTLVEESANEKKAMDLSNIPEPEQNVTTGGTTIEVNDGVADITYIAEYVLAGRVIDVQLYGGSGVADKLSPKDIGVTWGFLASDESTKKVKWSSNGNRFLYWNVPDGSWYQTIGGKNAVTTHHSNNHLIPSNEEIKNLVERIKKNDYIQVTGYLVKVYWKNDNGRWFRWNTSTVRNDDGDGACEIIYVTDVKWLE